MSTPRRALILIDVQQQYFSGPLEIQYPPHQESLPMIAKAVDAATAAGIPVAVIQHSAGEGAPVFAPGTPEFDLHPEIERRKPANGSRWSSSSALCTPVRISPNGCGSTTSTRSPWRAT
jgi:nicotinamidase-related amidase